MCVCVFFITVQYLNRFFIIDKLFQFPECKQRKTRSPKHKLNRLYSLCDYEIGEFLTHSRYFKYFGIFINVNILITVEVINLLTQKCSKNKDEINSVYWPIHIYLYQPLHSIYLCSIEFILLIIIIRSNDPQIILLQKIFYPASLFLAMILWSCFNTITASKGRFLFKSLL